MKKIITIIAMAALAAVAYANPVIYVVDIQEVHRNYYKTKAVQEMLQSTVDTAQAEVARMGEQHKALTDEATKIQEKLKNPGLSEDAKKEIVEKELAPKVNDMRRIEQTIDGFRRQASEKIQKQQNEVIAAHRKEILEMISKIAAEKKADFVIEKGVCHFSKPASNITEDVIAAMNANAPKN